MCLEAAVVGMRRWWQVKEQYDTFSFRLLSRRISEMYASYFSKIGFKKVKVLGLGLSPPAATGTLRAMPHGEGGQGR
jgi:predicted secreted protein